MHAVHSLNRKKNPLDIINLDIINLDLIILYLIIFYLIILYLIIPILPDRSEGK